MNFLAFQLKNLHHLIRKHRCVTFLMLLFVFISLLIFGKLISMSEESKASAKSYDETYGNKTYYFTNESLPDSIYYEYLDDEKATVYNKLFNFEEKLRDSKDFTYIEVIQQQLEITNPMIPEKFLINYEEGLSNKSVFEYENEILYATKALQVSPSFFEEYNIKISIGQPFSESDYIYNENKAIPVLLGMEYKDMFEIGDIIESYYIVDKLSFEVKGFIAEDTFFYSKFDNNMISCNRYMITPALIFETANELSRIVLLQKLTGIISSSVGYEETVDMFESYMQDTNVDNLDLNIIYPKAAQEGESIFDKYSAMTNEVANQFLIMVLIVMTFGIVATTVTICSMLRENRLNFGIEMLCGATKKDIFAVAFLFLLSVLLLSDALCSTVLFVSENNIFTLLYVQVVVIGMLVISGIISAIYVSKLPMHDIIGGNE